jgi:two-component sensor histidine kinase
MEIRRNKARSARAKMQAAAKRRPMLAAVLRIVLPYFVLGAAWILFSDRILLAFIDDPLVMISVSTYKGWFFILITGILLFFLVYGEMRRQNALEAELRDGLKEKSALLFELNHRVKNNLQVLASILNLESEDLTSEEARELNNRSKARIRALGLAHERLFEAGSIARVDVGAYLQTLWTTLLEVYQAKNVDASFALDEVFVGPLEAPPFGLFATEAMSNTIRFGASADGFCHAEIAIRRAVGGNLEFSLRDKGPGIAAGAEGLGIRLMSALADQLNGTLERYNDGGSVVRLRFPAVGEAKNG